MLDEYDTAQMYERLKRGLPMESYNIVDFDTGMTEEDIFAAVDALAPLPDSTPTEEKAWDTMTQEEQDQILAGLTNGT